jgi:NAD(P)-dependent dehydrogenase (short-subunit alcohol dehydrogenase family)
MASSALKKVLVTGAGTGFGHEAAMRLAEKGFDVIAGVEIYAQVQTLKRQAADRGVTLQVEKLDVTSDGDRRKALDWGVEILVNNAGVGEGLNVNPFTGIYSASKHAVEAIAETMADELQEYNIEVATVNPGPFLTGFNDRMFQTWESWEDDPSGRLFDYSKLAFPRAQFDPEAVYATLTAVAAGEVDSYRNLEPKSMIEETEHLQQVPWQRKVTDDLGTRHQAIQHSYEMQPETPVAS